MTVLYLAAGVAKANPLHTIPPFFCGKMISDGVMIFAGSYAVADVAGILQHGVRIFRVAA